jgi:hypothetical protein
MRLSSDGEMLRADTLVKNRACPRENSVLRSIGYENLGVGPSSLSRCSAWRLARSLDTFFMHRSLGLNRSHP